MPDRITLDEGDPNYDLASAVRELAIVVKDQSEQLVVATSSFDAALRTHRRATWLALASILLVVAVAVVVGHIGLEQVRSDQRAADDQRRREEADRRAEEQAACVRGNDIRTAVVRAVEVAVSRAAVRLAGDDPIDQAEAAQLAAEVAADVAADPALQPRACPGS